MRMLLIVAVAALASAAPAAATHSEGTGPRHDLAAGSGRLASTIISEGGLEFATAIAFSVNAHATEDGVRGHASFHGVDLTGVELGGKGEITCFQVNGRRAAALFAFGDERPFGAEFNYGLLVVEDNGEGGDPPDRAIATALSGPEGDQVVFCPAGLTFVEPLGPLVAGNVVVHDASP